ncbi:hypothetical protein BpHYR1_007131 [Brachionus plicatilis]|uniref:Uncharacterized protein n=1 Tax=Brachionus plicatilis TaxID=10195 RepID=A0A3M7QDY7_BRAPC|nr:hypothetical protein BpHYR1_007131 [Brachionus plicatilis]
MIKPTLKKAIIYYLSSALGSLDTFVLEFSVYLLDEEEGSSLVGKIYPNSKSFLIGKTNSIDEHK